MSALRVIVADDDRDTVTTLTELLREEGHDVRPVYRGMPEVPGHVVARKIRECCGHKRPLLIGISGRYKLPADKAYAEANGINHYLIKPCDPNSLIALLAPLQASS